ncbi:S8 family serine peptidase [Gottfriedia acidiceleris]|uniref:S8 family serine peptidase n=1 Tax=Gottfriedia acidiceleris TaxID=371036 RepID=UPI003D1B1FE0
MRKGKIGKVLMGTLAAGFVLSQGVPYNVLAQNTVKAENVDQVLMNLSDEQRKALEQLDAKPDFTISHDIDTNSSELVNVIVEFYQAPAKIEVMKQAAKGKKISVSEAGAKVEEVHKEFKQHVQDMKSEKEKTSTEGYDGKDIKITREYKNAINGVAMTLPGTAVEDLLQSGEVKQVFKDYEVKVEPPADTNATAQPKMIDSIPQIGVDKLHAENITGKGIKVGVIDTGIDYNHPDLRDSYKGYRAQPGVDPKTVDPNSVKGWDFINNDADPMETTYADWKKSGRSEFSSGSAYYTEHGTHVSGTIAAQQKNDVDYGVKGVAPDVDLYSYRVLGPYGSGSTTGIIAGIDKAIRDGMDVINLSLGDTINNPLSATSVAVNNAMLSGVVTVVAAGNSGPNEKTLGSPATAALGITVGASDVSMAIPSFSASASGETFEDLQLLGKDYPDKIETLEGTSSRIVFAGLGKATDFDGKDLNGKIALIQRGEIPFNDKIMNAKKAGAKAVIVYNNVDGQIPAYLGEVVGLIPSFRLSKEDGERLKALGEVNFTFGTLSNTKTEGDHLADFSSRGPVEGNDDIKPDVVAPGVAILSTVPEYINDPQDGINYSNAYERLQGTSMATPHVTGTAALILQQHPEYTPFDVKAALMNTADDLNGDYSVNEVGAGRIDAYQAVHAETTLKVLDKTNNIVNGKTVEIDEQTGSIMFGKFSKLIDKPVEASKKVAIQNHSNEEKTFKVEVEYHSERKGIQDGLKNGLKVSAPASITVASGTTQEIEPKISVPANAAAGRYEGYIHVTNTNNPAETYQIPFAIRINDRGFESMKVWEIVRKTGTPNQIHFYLNSPMETIDTVVKDKTGKPIGTLGQVDARNLVTNMRYIINTSMYIYRFTDDPQNPIESQSTPLTEGQYTIELVGHDQLNQTYKVNSIFVVDDTPAELTWEGVQHGNIYEIDDSQLTEEDGQRAFWVHGKVYDSTIDLLRENGLNYDQSSKNIVWGLENDAILPTFALPVKPDGSVKFGVTPEELEDSIRLRIYALDWAHREDGFVGPIRDSQRLTFIKKGKPYVAKSYSKEFLKLGDKLTVTLSLNNVKKFISGKSTVEYWTEFFKFSNVKVNDAFQKYANENGLNVNVDTPSITPGYSTSKVDVGASLSGSDFKGLDGDMPFLDVTFELIEDESYTNVDVPLYVPKFSYNQVGGTESIGLKALLQGDELKIVPKHSKGLVNIHGEAFYKTRGSIFDDFTTDYMNVGAKFYAKDSNGNVYDGIIEMKNGSAVIHDLPLQEKPYDFYVEIPGHLTRKVTVQPEQLSYFSKYFNETIANYYRIAPTKLVAGDVNSDNVIDLHDAIIVAKEYGKQNPEVAEADINQDGIVNETDIRFVEKNFLTKGQAAGNGQKPQEKIGPKTLESVLGSIGLEPKQ